MEGRNNYPVSAGLPLFQTATFRDIDEQAAQLAGYDQCYEQLGKGEFVGNFSSLYFKNDMSIHFEHVNRDILQLATAPDDGYNISILMKANKTCVYQGKDLPVGTTFFIPPGKTSEFFATAGMMICIINLKKSILEDVYSPCETSIINHIKFKPITNEIVCPPDRTIALRAFIADAYNKFSASSEQHMENRVLNDFTIVLLNLITWSFNYRDLDIIDPIETEESRRFTIYKQAARFIEEHLSEDLPTDKICHALKIRRRSLEYAFKQAHNSSPQQFIKILRLNRVRRDLLAPANHTVSIGDLAARHGFWHPSRFSRNYEEHFGELPSECRKEN